MSTERLGYKQSLNNLFNQFDVDGKGYFTLDQMRTVMPEAGNEAFSQLDADGDGVVSLQDFRSAYNSMSSSKTEVEYVLDRTIEPDPSVQFPSET